jgi:hypothetical protein
MGMDLTMAMCQTLAFDVMSLPSTSEPFLMKRNRSMTCALALTMVALLTLSFAPVPAFAQTNTLTALGTNNFSVVEVMTTAAYSQTTTTLTLVSPFTLGDTLGGLFSSTYDWSAYSNASTSTFGLFMSAAGASPGIPFTVEFYNEALSDIVNTYSGTASGLSASPTFVPMSLSLAGTGDFSSIGGMQLTWMGGGTGTVVVDSVAVTAVPEPSTYAMALAGLACGGYSIFRRRKRA